MRSNLLLSTLLKASALVGCTSQVTAQLGNDPADSWLVYAKAPGKDSKVLSVNIFATALFFFFSIYSNNLAN